MNTRTRLLLGVMLLFVGAWAADQMGLLSFLDQAGSGHERAMENVAKKIRKAEEIIDLGVRADEGIERLEAYSLPYDPEEARSVYHTWLTGLVEKHGIEKSTVEVQQPAPVTIKDGDGKSREAYHRYGFTMNGTGTLQSCTEWLYEFYRARHLQKITSLSLSPAGANRFNLSLAGEAIGIPSCDRKSELPSGVSKASRFDSMEDYALVVRRNIFSREAGSALKLIELTSITYDKQGLPEAWFRVGSQQETQRLQRNQRIEVSVHRLTVIDIQPASALVDLDGEVFDLPIGKTVYDVVNERINRTSRAGPATTSKR